MTGFSDLEKLQKTEELEQTLRNLDRASSVAGGAEACLLYTSDAADE